MTEAGRRALDGITARAAAAHDEIASGIAPTDIAAARRVLRCLIAAGGGAVPGGG